VRLCLWILLCDILLIFSTFILIFHPATNSSYCILEFFVLY